MIARKEEMQEADYLLLVVQGGVGRNIMTTAVVRNLKKAWPEKKIVVIATCPDVFLKNPYIDRVYNFGQPLFIYEDYFKKAKSVVLNVEPYQQYGYVYRTKHFVEANCEMLDIPCDSIFPEVYFSDSEMRMAELFVNKYDKELVLLQGEGGKLPDNASEKEKIISQSAMYKRSLKPKIMQEVTDELIKRGYQVGTVYGQHQFLPSMAEKVQFPIRAVLATIPYAAYVIGIDSIINHGAACFKKQALILWGGTDPKTLGYDTNINLFRESNDCKACGRPNSYLWDFEPTGFLWDCTHSKCMDFTTAEIMREFDKMTGGKDGRKKEPRAVCAGQGNTDVDKGGTPASQGGPCKGEGCPAV